LIVSEGDVSQSNDNNETAATDPKEQEIRSDSESEDLSNQYDENETPRETKARRAQVAAEILSVDAWSLTDSFMDNSDLLGELWEILDKPCPLSMVLSTYFMKINEHLLDMKMDEMLTFLLDQEKSS
jgi:SIT4-associating protein SAP185/190